MPDTVSSVGDWKIVAYHETGHAVVAKVLGRLIESIELTYDEQKGAWKGGTTHKVSDDPDWLSRNLDRYIPYDELRFQYSRHPDSYKNVREDCAIWYAGFVVEALYKEQNGIDENPVQLGGCWWDIDRARILVHDNFPPEEGEEELADAKSHVLVILRNTICWSMVENLAKQLIDAVKEDGSTNSCIFSTKQVYESFERTLIQGRKGR
jgi:hypothetical protein